MTRQIGASWPPVLCFKSVLAGRLWAGLAGVLILVGGPLEIQKSKPTQSKIPSKYERHGKGGLAIHKQLVQAGSQSVRDGARQTSSHRRTGATTEMPSTCSLFSAKVKRLECRLNFCKEERGQSMVSTLHTLDPAALHLLYIVGTSYVLNQTSGAANCKCAIRSLHLCVPMRYNHVHIFNVDANPSPSQPLFFFFFFFFPVSSFPPLSSSFFPPFSSRLLKCASPIVCCTIHCTRCDNVGSCVGPCGSALGFHSQTKN
jgi:hypothetical protein